MNSYRVRLRRQLHGKRKLVTSTIVLRIRAACGFEAMDYAEDLMNNKNWYSEEYYKEDHCWVALGAKRVRSK